MDDIERIQRRISLHDMRVFISVVQARSMGKAAIRLATSQPAVSRSIAQLEKAIGVRLLERSPQGIEPTGYGRALLRRGIAVFDEIAQGVKEVQFLADPTAGELRIGCSIAIGTGFVATIIDRLSRRYPRIAFQILATDSRFAYQALVDREVDIALLHLVKPSADDLMQAETLFHDPQLVVAGAHHPLTRRRRLKLSDLANEPWVFPPPDAPYGAMVVEAFHAAGLDVPKAVVTSTLPLRSALLATGRFLSIVPGVVLRFPTPDLSLRRLPVDLPSTSRPLAFLTLKNRTLNPVAELFRDCAREIAGLRANDK